MVHSDDWIEYKQLSIAKFDEITEIKKDIVQLKIQLAVLTTKVLLITTSVAFGISALATAIVNHFISKGV